MTKTIFIFYYSRTGNTTAIAEQIETSFSRLKSKDVEMRVMEAQELDLAALKSADGYIIGTPNYFGAPSGYVKVFFDELFMDRANLKGRPVFCFVSHGGSGDIRHLKAMCDWLELRTVGPSIVVKGKNVTPKQLADIENNIRKMLELI